MQLKDTIRWTADIGMYAIDRSREVSCVHASPFCLKTCFNEKLERAFGHAIAPKDEKNNAAWDANDTTGLRGMFSRSRKRQTRRGRFMTRGEAFATMDDVARVAKILDATPDTIWWIPTRAWKDPILFHNARAMCSARENVRLLASIDPSDSEETVSRLQAKGLSTMFYGDDDALEMPDGERRFKCPKTWRGLKGHCAICKAGCFQNKKPVHVHLKQH
jgi:hypothetical protein